MDELIYNEFSFLINKYNLKYHCQKFDIGGGWIISMHSFFNEMGCFTIYNLPSRGELYFYSSKKFSTEKQQLCEKIIDIYSIEKDVWNKYGKIGFIPNPFFWWNNKKILKVAAEIVKLQIEEKGTWMNIKI